MRLIDADVLKSKIREQPWKQETKVSLMLDLIYMLIDEASIVSTVQNKALQQENEQLKEQINTAKIGWDTYKTYSEQLEQKIAESNKIIKTQQQEIEKLKATLADWKYNAKCDADHIAALTTDKDELVKVLKQARESLQDAWDDDGSTTVGKQILDTINAIDALLGGEKDD